MNGKPFSVDDDQWPITPALAWIASRSFKFVQALGNPPPSFGETFFARIRQAHSPPLDGSLNDAFTALRKEIDNENFVETDWRSFFHDHGALRGFNEHELWLSQVTIAKSDLLRLWPPILDLQTIKEIPWRAPSGLSVKWLEDLPGDKLIPFSAIIDLLAFGRSRFPAGDALPLQLRASLVVDAARREGELELFGAPAKRNPKDPSTARARGPREKIAPNWETGAILLPVP
jgi:hypothetical protein